MTVVTPQRQRPRPTRWVAASNESPAQVVDADSAVMALPAGLIDGGEVVIFAIKPSLWRPVFDAAPWLVAVGLLALAVSTLGRSLPGLSTGATVQVIVLVGLTRLGISVIRWVPAWHVLTNRRVIDIFGVRTLRTRSCLLVELRNTYMRASTAEKLARVGTITFVSNQPTQPSWAWRSIRVPELIHEKIRRAVEHAIDQGGHCL